MTDSLNIDREMSRGENEIAAVIWKKKWAKSSHLNVKTTKKTHD